nr:MAG TPA: hypothetical protein [Caudoviricetes sp.]
MLLTLCLNYMSNQLIINMLTLDWYPSSSLNIMNCGKTLFITLVIIYFAG